MAERAKLRVIVQNLLSNAEKFTARGTIELSAGTAADGQVAVRVRDTGPGIPPEQQEAIFGLFHQLGEEPARRRGIGLGLALARRFARLMAGDVRVESRVGHGSTFTVTLPVAAARPGSTPSPA
jgi:signal transduction histidine kinase